jgi:hypothetical protein
MEAVLKVTDLTVSFPTENGLVTAVRGLSSISRLARWSALSVSLERARQCVAWRSWGCCPSACESRARCGSVAGAGQP